MFSFVLQTVFLFRIACFVRRRVPPSQYYDAADLLPEVIPPGEAPDLLLAAPSLLGDAHPAVRDDVESVPRGPLPHNVLA